MRNFEDLSPDEQIRVLKWMEDGLTYQTRSAVTAATYPAFYSAFTGKKEFNPAEIWNSINPTRRKHWEHIGKFIEILERKMDEIENNYMEKTIKKELETNNFEITSSINSDEKKSLPKKKNSKKRSKS